jgi:hypothetical protein
MKALFVKYSFIITLFVLFSGCFERGNTVYLDEGGEVSITLPYEPLAYNAGIIQINNDSSLLYFYNTATYKQVDIFSLKGEKLHTVPLINIKKEWKSEIEKLVLLSYDSILVLSKNTIFLLNSSGQILDRSVLFDTLILHAGIEFSSSYFSSFLVNRNTLLFHCDYYNAEKKNYIESLYNTNKAQPYFAKVSIYPGAKPFIKYGLAGFYNRFLKQNACNVELPGYTAVNNQVIVSSWYTDSIYVLDTLLKINKIICVHSKYTSLKSPAQTYQSITQDSVNFYFKVSGLITGVFYEEAKKLYYIRVEHEMNHNATREEMKEKKTSLIVYNQSFELIGEILLDKTTLTGEIISTPCYLLIKQKNYKVGNTYKFKIMHVKIN